MEAPSQRLVRRLPPEAAGSAAFPAQPREREPIAFRFFWIQHRGDDLAASRFNRHPSSGRARGNQKAGQSASF